MSTAKSALAIDFMTHLKADCQNDAAAASPYQIHTALSHAVMSRICDDWKKSTEAHNRAKKACYLSAEFLVGRAVFNNLLCLGLTQEADALLREHGASLAALEEIEDAALGNGGLGRLAACFLDSAATHNLPLAGYGIRYRYGLFKQSFVNGMQHEEADDWTRHGDPWSVRREENAVTVTFADQTLRAVPYDMPILGYGTSNIGTLRLWQAEPLKGFDFPLFNAQRYDESVREKNRAEDISRVLYPNDDTTSGKRLRIRQEYFLCSASIADLIATFKRLHGCDWARFAELHAIQLNDTHPVFAIPELLRRLIDDEGLSFDEAFAIAQKTFHFTNHTIMAEAMEKWSAALIRSVLPRIYSLIRLIDRRLKRVLSSKGMTREQTGAMAIVDKNTVHMARLAVYASSHTNGVAELHTQLLIQREMADWYAVYPERFQNKTNGITQRRWLALCNPELSALITGLLGGSGWMTDLSQLEHLEAFADDEGVLARFMRVKQEKKRQLAAYIARHEG
ncbi:MAG: glycogen/starch/alpha-glucan family phosphorylase, partial [Acetanaerobacterium sp.]